jgi:hypothetical protein
VWVLCHATESSLIHILLHYIIIIRDFELFNLCSSSKNCPSVRCAVAANVICRDVDF